MPMARFLADSKVAFMDPLPIAPNPTPTAIPSGILCTVTATVNSNIRFHLESRLFLLSSGSNRVKSSSFVISF